ncbi:hypothetical protein V8C86DRAFT_1353127 [Haematococcus lacustris]
MLTRRCACSDCVPSVKLAAGISCFCWLTFAQNTQVKSCTMQQCGGLLRCRPTGLIEGVGLLGHALRHPYFTHTRTLDSIAPGIMPCSRKSNSMRWSVGQGQQYPQQQLQKNVSRRYNVRHMVPNADQ